MYLFIYLLIYLFISCLIIEPILYRSIQTCQERRSQISIGAALSIEELERMLSTLSTFTSRPIDIA